MRREGWEIGVPSLISSKPRNDPSFASGRNRRAVSFIACAPSCSDVEGADKSVGNLKCRGERATTLQPQDCHTSTGTRVRRGFRLLAKFAVASLGDRVLSPLSTTSDRSSETPWPAALRSARRESSWRTVCSRRSWASSCESVFGKGQFIVDLYFFPSFPGVPSTIFP